MSASIEKRIHEAISGRWTTVQESDRHYRRATKIARAFPGLTPEDYDQDSVVEFLRVHNNGTLKPSTINKYLSVLSGLGFKVQFQSEEIEERRILTAEELSDLDGRVRSQSAEPIFKAMYAILRDTGCRGLAELNRLKPEHIDWQRRTVEFTSYKGKRKTRKVPLTEVSERSLAWWVNSGCPEWPSGSRWWSFWSQVRPDKNSKPYDLRHTFCTRLLENKVEAEAVCKIMGHTNLEQTLRYHHLTTAALERARQALQNL